MKNILLKLGAFHLIDAESTANSDEFQRVLLKFGTVLRRLEQVEPIVKEGSKPDAASDRSLSVGQYNGITAQILWSVEGWILQKQVAIQF